MPFDHHPRRTDALRLADGRLLGFAEFGDPDGAPVLFIAGAASSRAMNAGGAELRTRGIRLITVDRPGLGESSPVPARTFAGVAADLEALLDHLGLDRVPVLANSQGAPFALALALGPRVSRLVLASPADEVAHPAVFAQLPEQLQGVVRSTAEDPEGARSFLGGFDADRMFEMVLGSPAPADAELAADDGFRALYRRALEEGFAAGPDGYVGDTLLAMRPWELPLDRITVPVTIWFGDQDASHSPDHGATLAARIPGARRIVVPGEGGLLLWTRTADVLASVTGAGEPVDRR